MSTTNYKCESSLERPRKIPNFQTLGELVALWEEHDFADYWDELVEVEPEEAMPLCTRHEEEEQL